MRVIGKALVITRHALYTQSECQDFSSRKCFYGEGLGVDEGLQMVENSSVSLSERLHSDGDVQTGLGSWSLSAVASTPIWQTNTKLFAQFSCKSTCLNLYLGNRKQESRKVILKQFMIENVIKGCYWWPILLYVLLYTHLISFSFVFGSWCSRHGEVRHL